MAKATDGLAFGVTRHCRIAGVGGMGGSPSIRQCRVTPKAKPSVALAIVEVPPMSPTPEIGAG